MITEDYVSFENAKLLKEKGFNEPCRLYYDKYHGWVPIFVEDSKLTEYGYKDLVRNDQDSISDFIASAPSLYVAMKWLREVHNIHINLDIHWLYFANSKGWMYVIERILENGVEHVDCKGDESDKTFYLTYEQAADAAIKYCLENLI